MSVNKQINLVVHANENISYITKGNTLESIKATVKAPFIRTFFPVGRETRPGRKSIGIALRIRHTNRKLHFASSIFIFLRGNLKPFKFNTRKINRTCRKWIEHMQIGLSNSFLSGAKYSRIKSHQTLVNQWLTIPI